MKFAFYLFMFLTVTATAFYDDFEDNDISDWEQLGNSAYWSAGSGKVLGYTDPGTSQCELVPLDSPNLRNLTVETYAKGVHNFGVCARYDENDTRIVAYVSPDNNVARIRMLNGEIPGTILNSIYEDFPSNVWYHLTLICSNDVLAFIIEVPGTGQSWVLTAEDPDPRSGRAGLHMAEEPGALWDWFSAEPFTEIAPVISILNDGPILSASPNPAIGQVLLTIDNAPDHGYIDIFDITGRIAGVVSFNGNNGSASAVWNREHSSGGAITPGVYFARISGTDAEPVRLLVLE